MSRHSGMLIEQARQQVEHALEAIGAAQYGEAWLALQDAMRKLEQAEEDGAPQPACPRCGDPGYRTVIGERLCGNPACEHIDELPHVIQEELRR